MLVKNLNGTADNKAPYGYISWLDFWEKKSGKKAHECAHCRAKPQSVHMFKKHP